MWRARIRVPKKRTLSIGAKPMVLAAIVTTFSNFVVELLPPTNCVYVLEIASIT